MIRTLLTPQQQNISIQVPQSYVGKPIEVLLFALDEPTEEKIKPKKSMSDFCGILSEKEYQSLKEHTEQARKEWNRPI